MNRNIRELAQRLALHVRRDILSGTGGTLLAHKLGTGLEFSELRDYHPSDDARHLHWPSVRSHGTPRLKVFQEEQEIRTCIALDISSSMTSHFATWKLATETAALLAGVATLCSNGGSLFLFSQGLASRTSMHAGERELRRLTQIILQAAPAPRTVTQLPRALDAIANALQKPTRLFLISDFLEEQDCQAPLRRLNHRHQTTLCHTLPADDTDSQAPELLPELEDAETGQRLMATVPRASLIQVWQERTRALAKATHTDYILLDGSQSPLQALLHHDFQNATSQL